MKRDPYPLQWPEGWKRTSGRRTPLFQAKSFAQVRDSVIRQLRKRGSHIVITSDLPTRNDGLPYANASCQDPGVAVYWVEKGHERVIACDRWKSVALNLRAIDMSLEAMRALDRWGAAEMVDKAFAGFAALPAGDGTEHVPPPPERKPWWRVFDIDTSVRDLLGKAEVLALVKGRHRLLIMSAHPDRGGTHERAAELNAALAEAEKDLA